MKVAILSDTHLPRFGRALPAPLVDGIVEARVDHILHAGDWTSPLALELVSALAPVTGVAGNNDAPELVEALGLRRVVELDGARIGLTHGHLRPGATTRDRALRAFADAPGLAAIVFGHSHIPLIERLADGRWLVNPGSPTDKRRQPQFSWALMTIEAGEVRAVELRRYARR